MSKATTRPPSRRLVPSSRAKEINASAPVRSPSGRASTWPVLKVRFHRLWPIHSASATCGRSAGAASSRPLRSPTRSATPSPDRISLALARVALIGSSRWPPASISVSLSPSRSTGPGLRSTMSTTSVSGSSRETRASSTQLSCSRSSRTASRSTIGIARARWASTRSYTFSSLRCFTPCTSTRCTSKPACEAMVATCWLAMAGTPASTITSQARPSAQPRMTMRKMR